MFSIFVGFRPSGEEFKLFQPALDAREQSRQTLALTLDSGFAHPFVALLKLKEVAIFTLQ